MMARLLRYEILDNAMMIKKAFDTYFSAWGITLPDEALQSRKLDKINSKGWEIRYLFGKDDRGDYLDFYATHRMTNDRHVRIYSTGETEELPAILGMVVYPANASDKEKKEIEEKYLKHCQSMREMLKEKGFFDKVNENDR